MPQRFYIFGNGISFSKSPAIHNAAFRHLGLSHTYEIRESPDVGDFEKFIEREDFGGCSVTMPHKLAISRYCDQVTEDAKCMGAVNTLIVGLKQGQVNGQPGRWITGDNSDWDGLRSIITNHFSAEALPSKTGLVIGAGGASRAAVYAMYRSGVREILLVNRTTSKAEQIAADFATLFAVKVIPDLGQLQGISPGIIIGTIPAHQTREEQFSMLFSKSDGLCIDMAYKPQMTPLLKAAAQVERWKCVGGVEVLLHQAFVQFRWWTGLDPPKEVMREAAKAT